MLRARVLGDIDQQFADGLKYENRLFFRDRQVVLAGVDRNAQLALAHVFTQPLQRGYQTELLQDRRTQLGDESS